MTRQELTDAIGQLPADAHVVLRTEAGDHEIMVCPADIVPPEGERTLNGLVLIVPGNALTA